MNQSLREIAPGCRYPSSWSINRWEPSKEYPQEVRSHLKPLKALLRAHKNQDAVCLVTVIFLAKKLAGAGKPCLVTLLPGGVAWSVTLASAPDLHKAQGWASLAQLQRGS